MPECTKAHLQQTRIFPGENPRTSCFPGGRKGRGKRVEGGLGKGGGKSWREGKERGRGRNSRVGEEGALPNKNLPLHHCVNRVAGSIYNQEVRS